MYLGSLITSFSWRLDLAICEDVMKLRQVVIFFFLTKMSRKPSCCTSFCQLDELEAQRSGCGAPPCSTLESRTTMAARIIITCVFTRQMPFAQEGRIRPYGSTASATLYWRETSTILLVWLAQSSTGYAT
jgi:hypothetical protein